MWHRLCVAEGPTQRFSAPQELLTQSDRWGGTPVPILVALHACGAVALDTHSLILLTFVLRPLTAEICADKCETRHAQSSVAHEAAHCMDDRQSVPTRQGHGPSRHDGSNCEHSGHLCAAAQTPRAESSTRHTVDLAILTSSPDSFLTPSSPPSPSVREHTSPPGPPGLVALRV